VVVYEFWQLLTLRWGELAFEFNFLTLLQMMMVLLAFNIIHHKYYTHLLMEYFRILIIIKKSLYSNIILLTYSSLGPSYVFKLTFFLNWDFVKKDQLEMGIVFSFLLKIFNFINRLSTFAEDLQLYYRLSTFDFRLSTFVITFFVFENVLIQVRRHGAVCDAHVEAPVRGSIILAGILLKLGGYGLLRTFDILKALFKNPIVNYFATRLLCGLGVPLVQIGFIRVRHVVSHSSVCWRCSDARLASSYADSYPNMRDFAGHILAMFGSTYTCEQLFSKLNPVLYALFKRYTGKTSCFSHYISLKYIVISKSSVVHYKLSALGSQTLLGNCRLQYIDRLRTCKSPADKLEAQMKSSYTLPSVNYMMQATLNYIPFFLNSCSSYLTLSTQRCNMFTRYCSIGSFIVLPFGKMLSTLYNLYNLTFTKDAFYTFKYFFYETIFARFTMFLLHVLIFLRQTLRIQVLSEIKCFSRLQMFIFTVKTFRSRTRTLYSHIQCKIIFNAILCMMGDLRTFLQILYLCLLLEIIITSLVT
ncbi:hypothetical protein L9F63_025907, partial [Diploptera punctata]